MANQIDSYTSGDITMRIHVAMQTHPTVATRAHLELLANRFDA